MWIKKKEYEELKELAYKYPEVEERAYKWLYADARREISDLENRLHNLKDSSEKEKQAIIKEKNKLYKLAYNKEMFGNTPYKELHKKQQLLNNNLTQEVHELKKEIKKLKGLRTYSTMTGEYEAHSVRIDGDFLEIIRDGEVIARWEDTAYEVVD